MWSTLICFPYYFLNAFQNFFFIYIQKCNSLYFLFLFLACQSFQSHHSFFPSVPPCSLFSPKHKWMHGHLCWESQAHTLEASRITLPCIAGCRICPGPRYLKGWVGAWEKLCLCVPYTASSRSVNAGHQQIQSDFWVKYKLRDCKYSFGLYGLLHFYISFHK